MKPLLKITALIEVPTGLGLIAAPAFVVRLLLGAEVSGAGIPVSHVAGVALLALGGACWLASYDEQSCAERGVVSGMVIYNLGAVIIFVAAGIGPGSIGIGLWPAAVLHTAMAIWCVTSLLRKPGPDH